MKRLIAVALATAAAPLAVGIVSPAHAGPATGSVNVGTQYGSVLRAEFRQNVDGTGYYWRTYGGANCSSSTSSADFSWSNMNSNNSWNDVTSYIKDFALCDVKIYRNVDFGDALTGYVNYGSGGQSLAGAALNNRTSSYRLS